jgi:hypothetical protein
VIDPEDKETPGEREKRLRAEHSKSTSERLSEDVWFIPSPEGFEEEKSRMLALLSY